MLRKIAVFFLQLITLAFLAGAAGGLVLAAYKLSGIVGGCGALLLAIAFTLIPAYRNVPTLKLGMVTFLGIRTGRVFGEGPHFVIPWFESVALFSREVWTMEVKETFYCADNLAVIVEGTLQSRIDPELLSTAYVENQHAIRQGLSDAIRSEIGSVAGANSALDFKGAWEAISNLINCSLRMGRPPHIAQNLRPEERLKFYADAQSEITGLLEGERRLAEERSEIENRYGIEVIAFSVGRVWFTEKTSEALEEEGRAILRSKAHRVVAKTAQEIAKDRREEGGLKPEDAENAAEVAMKLSERKIHTLDGLGRFRPFQPPESRSIGGFLCRTN